MVPEILVAFPHPSLYGIPAALFCPVVCFVFASSHPDWDPWIDSGAGTIDLAAILGNRAGSWQGGSGRDVSRNWSHTDSVPEEPEVAGEGAGQRFPSPGEMSQAMLIP
eukprot:2218315-Pyramimonas_sp.AAC.1